MKKILLALLLSTSINIAHAEENSLSELIMLNYINDAKQLIEAGVNVNQLDEDGQTALAVACTFHRLDIAKLLVKAGADINAKDEDGISVVEGCTLKPYIDKPEPVVDYLISIGAK
ncbi:MAG: ankyrin repeat domain-containing protein [OCS116 cluster bacterium]|nr:ankyrin repeat domain-containing protein [OCS116 cluster bacterium]